jgi:hypothetical protein
LIMPYPFSRGFIRTRECHQVCDCWIVSSLNFEPHTEFDQKRQNAVSTNERLQQEAQAVLDVIENPDVAQALRQDKNQNLSYLKDNYGVRSTLLHRPSI